MSWKVIEVFRSALKKAETYRRKLSADKENKCFN